MSAMGHSGRFSLRMAMRSPVWMPQACSACAVRATLRPNSRDETGSHLPASRYSMMRSRSRATAAKKMSLRVVMLGMLIASFMAHSQARFSNWPRETASTELYCFESGLGNVKRRLAEYYRVYRRAQAGYAGPSLLWEEFNA